MSKPLLPPRGIFASTRLVFHRSLPASVKETVLQLMALSWTDSQHATPPMTYLQLEELTGKDKRTLRGHLRALREAKAIVGQNYLDEGIFSLNLASWLFRNEPVGRADAKKGEEGDAPGLNRLDARTGHAEPTGLEGGGTHAAGGTRAAGGQSETGQPRPAASPGARTKAAAPPAGEESGLPAGRKKNLSKAFQKELLAFGVFPVLLKEVASSSYSEDDLRALLAWCRIDAPDAAPRLFIGRLRAGARAPRAYHGEPCDVCGQYGKHAPDCRRRYAQDIYVNG